MSSYLDALDLIVSLDSTVPGARPLLGYLFVYGYLLDCFLCTAVTNIRVLFLRSIRDGGSYCGSTCDVVTGSVGFGGVVKGCNVRIS